MREDVRGIILAAGMGKRMGDLTKEIPKCLVPVAGRPLIEWQVDALRQAGVEQIGVVRGYLGHKIGLCGVHYFENVRWDRTNMVSSLCCGREWLRAGPCVVSYSDIVYPARTICSLIEAEGDIVIGNNLEWRRLWESRFEDPLADAETFRVSPAGVLLEIGGKPGSLDEIEGQYMGLLKFTPEGWARVETFLREVSEADRRRLDMTALLQKLLVAGMSVRTVPIRDLWFEIDSEADLEVADRMLSIRDRSAPCRG